MDIKGVVIPAAGLGTRFLPYTKVVPKEMLPIINKPAIEYIIQEAIMSGIKDFFIITNKNKRAISDYFYNTKNFKKKIQDKQKLDLLSDLDKIIDSSNFYYINQEIQMGLGHAILMAKNFIKNNFFGVMLPDDLIFNTQDAALYQLIKIANRENATVIGVQEVPNELVSSYGIVEIYNKIDSNLFKISNLIEKPSINNAPSNLAIVGRYVLSNRIFDSIEKIEYDSKNEIQLTNAITDMLKRGNKVFAYKVQGYRYDIGTPSGWLKANVDISRQLNFNS